MILFKKEKWKLKISLDSTGTCWNPLEFTGIHWNLLESTGNHWNPQEFGGNERRYLRGLSSI